MFTLEAVGSSALRPGAIQVKTSSNKLVHPQVTQTASARKPESFLLATLNPGNYTIFVRAAHGSSGAFELNVSLAGDVNGDGRVDQSDLSSLNADLGARSSQSRYVAAADVNNSGKVDKSDYKLAKQNLGISTSIRPLEAARFLDASSAPDSSGVVHQGSVTVDGVTAPGAVVSLSAPGAGVSSLSTTAGSTGAFQFTFNVPLGTTQAQISVRDSFGQQVATTLAIARANPISTADHTPPTITISSPASGALTNTNVTVKGTVADSQSGVTSLEAALDGAAFSAVSFNATTGAFSYVASLVLNGSVDGPHTIALRGTDLAGNSTTVDETFTLDTVAPSITITAAEERRRVSTSPTVAGILSDIGTGVASLQARLDAGVFTSVAVGAGGSFSFATGLATDGSDDGAHVVTFEAADRAGNAFTAELDFTLSTTEVNPTITIQSPASGGSFKTDPTIQGTVVGTTISSLEARVDGGPTVLVTFDATSSAFSFTPSVALDGSGDGGHTVRFTALDSVGHSASRSSASRWRERARCAGICAGGRPTRKTAPA